MNRPACDFRVAPGGVLRGRLRVPGDKSISHRALLLGGLAEGETEIRGLLEGADCMNTRRAMEALGIVMEEHGPGRLRVQGQGGDLRAAPGTVDCGNSGTGMRLLTGALCGRPFDTTLVGDASLSRRPMGRIIEPLSRMGARIDSEDGHAPLTIRAGTSLRGIDYASPVASAQVKSAVLLAGLSATGRTEVSEPQASRDHSERMLRSFGIELEASPGQVRLQGGQTLKACEVEVPADLSSAAFFLVGASITPGSDLVLEDVGVNPGRIGIVAILGRMGADISLENERMFGAEPVADLRVRGGELRGVDVEPDEVAAAIDEFPALFVAAACARGETRVRGAAELRIKESDRIWVMVEALVALGIDAEAYEDGARIRGGTLGSGRLDSHGDHRVAMSLAMAGLRAAGPLSIGHCANVATSFPDFEALARSAGLGIEATAVAA